MNIQDLRISVPTKAVKTSAHHSQSMMNQALQLAELPFQDIVIYLYIEKPMDTHQELFTAVHPNVQVSFSSLYPSLKTRKLQLDLITLQ